jgi:hypothetical protein
LKRKRERRSFQSRSMDTDFCRKLAIHPNNGLVPPKKKEKYISVFLSAIPLCINVVKT